MDFQLARQQPFLENSSPCQIATVGSFPNIRCLVTRASGPCQRRTALMAARLSRFQRTSHGPEARVTVQLLVGALLHRNCPPISTGRAARQGYQRRNMFRANLIRGSESTKKNFRGGCFPKSARCAPAARVLTREPDNDLPRRPSAGTKETAVARWREDSREGFLFTASLCLARDCRRSSKENFVPAKRRRSSDSAQT